MRIVDYLVKKLFFLILFGILFGIVFSKVTLLLFPSLTIEIKNFLPIYAAIGIFIKNSFLLTLICFGGLVFSFVELRIYRFSKFYRVLDKIFDPLYSFLELFSKDYRRLGPMYRSCYFSLSCFPLVCIFLFFFLIAFYFSLFLFIFGISKTTALLRFFPHLFLESLAFISSTFIAIKIAEKLKKYILRKNTKKFKIEGRKILVDRKIWKKMLLLYLILLISAFVEKFFIESI